MSIATTVSDAALLDVSMLLVLLSAVLSPQEAKSVESNSSFRIGLCMLGIVSYHSTQRPRLGAVAAVCVTVAEPIYKS